MNQNLFMNAARVAELWAAVKVAVSKCSTPDEVEQAIRTAVAKCSTADEVAEAIQTAVARCSTPAEVSQAITTALGDYMTAGEAEAAINQAVATAADIQFKAVDTLPESGEAKTVYLVPAGEDSNVRNQYMWLDEAWVNLGSTEVNLTNCWDKEDLRVMTAEELAAILV